MLETNITSDKNDTSTRVLTHDINAIITIPSREDTTKPDVDSAKFLVFSVDAVKDFLFANYFWLNDQNIEMLEIQTDIFGKELSLLYEGRVLAYIKYINPLELNSYFIDFIQNNDNA